MPSTAHVYALPPSTVANAICLSMLSGETAVLQPTDVQITWPKVVSESPLMIFHSTTLAGREFVKEAKDACIVQDDSDPGEQVVRRRRKTPKSSQIERST